ncbi:hypothetical protein [uncultured Thiodictyon sp.]|uniref:hypothetical protein n=1 Tax=uncultured Thiodictyon sp. TaxID=1846217 RepID=UPI0025F2FCF5|nr:hypothetical protein [uncultured Thiodictyon sp.]
MNETDIAFLNNLADPRAPFVDIVRAIYRANRLICESARDALTAQLDDIQDALNVPGPLVPQNLRLQIWPKADAPNPWDYDRCKAGAVVWLPNPVDTKLRLFVEFGDQNYIVVGLEFINPTRRNRWVEQFPERPGLIEEEWEAEFIGYTLVMRRQLDGFATLDGELTGLLTECLSEIRRVRVLNPPQ